MPNKSADLSALARLVFILCLVMSSAQARKGDDSDDEDSNTRMYELFWTIFWLAVLGFLIYLLCTYPVWDWTMPPNRAPPDEPVINVRIVNPLPLHNG